MTTAKMTRQAPKTFCPLITSPKMTTATVAVTTTSNVEMMAAFDVLMRLSPAKKATEPKAVENNALAVVAAHPKNVMGNRGSWNPV